MHVIIKIHGLISASYTGTHRQGMERVGCAGKGSKRVGKGGDEWKGRGGQGKLGGVGKGYVVPVCLAQTSQTPPEKESKGGRHDIAKFDAWWKNMTSYRFLRIEPSAMSFH